MAYVNDWDENSPIDHSKFKAVPGAIRKVAAMVGERFSSMVYGFVSGETLVGFKKAIFNKQAAAPAPVNDGVVVYGKEVNGKTELFAQDADGNEVQLTAGGRVMDQSTYVGDYKYSAQAADHGRWLLCTPGGRNVSREVYADLFAVIGTKFGAGDGSTTFGLPDPGEGRTLLAKDTRDTDFSDLGKSGGAKTVKLTGAQSGVAPHTHSWQMSLGNDNGLQHRAQGTNGAGSNVDVATSTCNSQDAAEAHNNMSPYLVGGNLFIRY